MTPLISNDAIVLGLLTTIIAVVFNLSESRNLLLKNFFNIFPPVLFCYFIPALLNSTGVISGEISGLYKISSRYFLPASLALFCLSLDFKAIAKLGPRALIMFSTATFGIIVGGPIALWLVSLAWPELLHNGSWRGLSTLAGTWIGGAANQTALKEIYKPTNEMFALTIAIDLIISNLWLTALLFLSGNYRKIDKVLKAKTLVLEKFIDSASEIKVGALRSATFNEIFAILAVGLGACALAHAIGGGIATFVGSHYPALAKFSFSSDFFWIVLISTLVGIIASFTPLRRLEEAGSSKIASVFLFLMIASIGMNMNVSSLDGNLPLLLVGLIWILIHGSICLIVGRITRTPFFFSAVSSQAIIGGAASAPIVAATFNPLLAPIGVLLAVLGYSIGTYGAILCAYLMQLL